MENDLKKQNTLATRFRKVDEIQNQTDMDNLILFLKYIDGLPPFAAYKARCLEMLHLHPGDTAVDLGCGLGFDVQRMACQVSPQGTVIGIDNSAKLLAAAHESYAGRKGIKFIDSDIHQIPLDTNSVDAIKIDRTLQHVKEPQRVISEMARVLKPGGRFVCAEPAWSAFSIASVDTQTSNIVIKEWVSGIRNPDIGLQLLEIIQKQTLQNTWTERFTINVHGFDAVNIVYDISRVVDILQGKHLGDEARFSRWLDRLKQCDDATPLTSSTIILTGGQKASQRTNG